MNILQLCKFYPPVLGGIELVEKTITKAHTDLDDNVVVVAFANEAKETVGEFAEKIYLIKQDLFLKSAPFNFSFIFSLRKVIEKNEISRIYVHLPNPFMHEVLRLCSSFLKEMKVEVMAVYHSDIVNQRFLGAIYDYYFHLSKDIYTGWICSSQKLWDSSKILKNIDQRKKIIIPFCTEGQIVFRKRERFEGKLLAVGRLVPYKGFEFLINALKGSKYELNIIGDGPEYEKLKNIAGANVILHRRISDSEKQSLYEKCDLLIVPSINRAEAYGMIIVEAFEAGLPVVASNLDSGVTYLVQHEKTGLVFEIKNREQLLAAIERFAQDQTLYQQVSINSRDFFDSELSYPHFKDKIKNLRPS